MEGMGELGEAVWIRDQRLWMETVKTGDQMCKEI
jgi:hypothetical protein